jgi:hypothetical protein
MKSLRRTRQRVGRISSAAGITALLVGGVSAGAVLAGPAASAFAGTPGATCESLTPPSNKHVDGQACYTIDGSQVDVTITLSSGTVSNVYLCYAAKDVSFTSPSQCAGNTDSMFDGQATPQGGLTASGSSTFTFSLDIVASPKPGDMQVAPGDYLYLHVGQSGCSNGDDTSGQFGGDPFQVPPANGVPVADPAVVAGIVGVGIVGLGLVGARRRRARVTVES